jgi:hypothetical protein
VRRRLIALLLVAFFVPLFLTVLPPARAADERCFAETGFCLQGRFLEYWEAGGGLAIYGFPISAELWEDKRLVQYFERNRFEFHPENARPFDVLLGLLGVERLRADGRDHQSDASGRALQDCRFFPETGHSLCGRFREYWEQNGGLALFGYPITEPAEELSETDGQVYLVQYFERNRFEFHPENARPFDVLLGLLGSWRANWLLADVRAAHPLRADVLGLEGAVAPLDRVTLRVSVPGYAGPAEVRLFDAAGRLQLRQVVPVTGGEAIVPHQANGALGPHAAVVLIDGQIAGISSTAYLLDAETNVSTGVERYDQLWPIVRRMQAQNVSTYIVDGQPVRGHRSPDSYLIWMRDHVYQALGYRYFDRDMTSALDYFRRSQRADGSFDDFFAFPPWGKVQGRMEVEADLEFLFTQGVFQAWQATGDDGWLRACLPAIERGLAYITSDPKRWEPSLGLVKRPFTIDTWDFEFGGPDFDADGKPIGRHKIDDQTKWGIMHGDNTGLAYAMQILGQIYERQGDFGRAGFWRGRAAEQMQRLNGTSWNGRFFTHQVLLQPVDVPGVDLAQQLSLSNAYALNRNVLSFEQATGILNEYQRRRAEGRAFAEWYSIDPPFPPNSFGTGPTWGDIPGTYVNGGILPLVGGELARGAFRWGQETYGFDILSRYHFMLTRQGGSYLWYYAAGNPGISGTETINTDGWGSSAMVAALFEGAAGVADRDVLFRDVLVAPRWAADPAVDQAQVTLRYGASYGYVSYRWERLPEEAGLRMQVASAAQNGTLRVLLPVTAGERVFVTVGGVPVAFAVQTVAESRYVELPMPLTTVPVEITWR